MERVEEIAQTKEVQQTEETKLDRILNQNLTIQGQMTIIVGQMEVMQGQITAMQGQITTIQEQITVMQEQNNKRFDKIEADHEEFKSSLGILLDKEFEKRDKAILKQGKAIKKLQAKPSLLSCIKSGIKKFVPKQN